MVRGLFILFLLIASIGNAQTVLSGTVVDEYNSPIPLAKVFAKNDPSLRVVCDVNGYFELQLMPAEYFFIIRAGGYMEREEYVVMTDMRKEITIQLLPVQIQDIAEMEVSAKKSNPGREIMLKVVEKRDVMNPWNYAHRCEVYIKGVEQFDKEVKKESNEKSKKEKEKDKEKPEVDANDANWDDPFGAPRINNAELNMNLFETQLTREYEPRNKIKESRNAFKEVGKTGNLYYKTTVKSQFNFFENLLHLDDLHLNPISSPISTPGILSYKYRLVEQYEENGQKIHKIEIIPRNIATTTLAGFIYVIDSSFLVQRIDLTMEKGNLLYYDYFSISQEFEHLGDSVCVLSKQILDYGVKNKSMTSKLNTTATFQDYDFNVSFEKRYFSNELSVITEEAYSRDSSYWESSRTTPLTPEEVRFIQVQDSIRAYYSRKEYTDSIDSVFNRITFLKVIWFGIDHRNRAKKNQWTISSVAATSRPIYIAGPRVAPSLYFYKKWDSERFLDTYSETSYGFLNRDVKGSIWGRFRYDPFHLGTLEAQFDHDFDVIRAVDAITQIYKRDNFIERTAIGVNNENEILNGLYLGTGFSFAERRSLKDYKFLSVLDEGIPNNDPTSFQTYQAMIGRISLSYTPGQKYMREPKRKVILGSKWPTFYVNYERGIPKLFGSDVDHEYLGGGLSQTFQLGLLGTTSYNFMTGKFLSAKALYDADFRFLRRSDPIWFSNPLNSFQDLDSTLPTRKIFYELHGVHHDNGAILNKIPFMKKTRIGLVVGAGALYVQEFNYQHYELLAGLERIFKLSKRRLRIGAYGVITDGNTIKPRATWKISFALLDDRSMKFNF